MSPYRRPSERSNGLVACGRRWGATRWAKFWVKRPKLWRAADWSLRWLVVVPIVVVVRTLMLKDPFDF